MRVLDIEESGKKSTFLHKNDKKILAILCKNVRIPLSKIAKLVLLSRQSVEYRIKVMEREKLLVGSRTMVNISKLGYASYHFFLNLQDRQSEKELIERSMKSPYVNTLITYSGKWTFEVSIMAKSPHIANKEFKDLVKDLNVIDYSPCIILDTVKANVLPPNLIGKAPAIRNVKNDPSFSRFFGMEKKDYKADSKDLEILYQLSQNADSSLLDMGKKVGLTKDAVSYRIKKLILGGYIAEFRPVINFYTLNLKLQAVLIKTTSKGREDAHKFDDFLKKQNSILWATRLFGTWDYLVYVLTEHQEEIHNFVNNIKDSFGDYIHSYEILYAYHDHKYSFMTEAMRHGK